MVGNPKDLIKGIFESGKLYRQDWEECGFGNQSDFAPWDFDFQSDENGYSEMQDAIELKQHSDERDGWLVKIIKNRDKTCDYYSCPRENEDLLYVFLEIIGYENTK